MLIGIFFSIFHVLTFKVKKQNKTKNKNKQKGEGLYKSNSGRNWHWLVRLKGKLPPAKKQASSPCPYWQQVQLSLHARNRHTLARTPCQQALREEHGGCISICFFFSKGWGREGH